MQCKYIIALSGVIFLTGSLPLSAQDAGLSWDFSAVSEYLYRSVSQSDETPTVQGEISWMSPVGVYAGSWVSGVDFGPGSPKVEVDYYLGYAIQSASPFGFDVRLARYTNPGASDLAWNELITTTTLADSWTLAVHYSNDVFASDTAGGYVAIGKRWGLPLAVSFSAHAGRSLFRRNAVVGRDYTDWNIGLSRQFDGRFGVATMTLGYYGTDSHGRRNYGKLANQRVFLAVSVGG